METELLHEYGLNEQNRLIKAIDAQKDGKYICPGCKTVFILRKSGNTSPGSRRPHFAHNNLEDGCSYESYLHKIFILQTVEFLTNRITNNQPIVMQWNCHFCKQRHSANFTGIFGVKPEFSLKERKPDIALFGQAGNVIAAIEIIYKHPPEEGAIQFYRQHNILLIQINITSEDLDNVEQKISNPSSFDFCLAPKIPAIRMPILTIPHYKPYNGIPRDFIDHPEKYYSKNGNFYPRKGRGRRF